MRHLLSAAALVLVSTLASPPARADQQTRSTAAFTAIDLRGPINIEVQAGQPQSISVRGSSRFIGLLVTEVVDGELRVHLREDVKSVSGDARVIVTVPALHKFNMEGAGETVLRGVAGERFDVNYRGAGRMAIGGAVKQLNLQAQGVGEVDTRQLLAQDANVRFQGIGSVQVYASGRLDAKVNGMGELRYYGHPRTVTRTVSGIGSVSAGD